MRIKVLQLAKTLDPAELLYIVDKEANLALSCMAATIPEPWLEEYYVKSITQLLTLNRIKIEVTRDEDFD